MIETIFGKKHLLVLFAWFLQDKGVLVSLWGTIVLSIFIQWTILEIFFFVCAWCQRWSTGDLPPHVCNTDKPTMKTASQNIFAKDVMDTFSTFLEHTAAAERSRLKLKSCKRIYPLCTSLVGCKNQAITKSFSASTIWHCQDSHYINLNFKLNGNVHNV